MLKVLHQAHHLFHRVRWALTWKEVSEQSPRRPGRKNRRWPKQPKRQSVKHHRKDAPRQLLQLKSRDAQRLQRRTTNHEVELNDSLRRRLKLQLVPKEKQKLNDNNSRDSSHGRRNTSNIRLHHRLRSLVRDLMLAIRSRSECGKQRSLRSLRER